METKWSVRNRPGRDEPDDEWFPLELEPHGPDPGEHRTRRRPGMTSAGLAGLFLVAIAATALILNFTVPWMLIEVQVDRIEGLPPDAGAGIDPETMERDDFSDSGTKYMQRLVHWPTAAMIVAMAAGVLLAAIDLIGGLWNGIHRGLQVLLLATVAFFGFLTALVGTRFLGALIVNRMSQDNPAQLTLFAPPYVNLGVGLFLLTAAVLFARRPLQELLSTRMGRLMHDPAIRATGIMTLVAALGLLLMPLLPFVALEGSTWYLDEWDLTFFTGAEERIGDAANALESARAMIWIVLYASLGGLLLSITDRTLGGRKETRFLLLTQLLVAIPLVVTVVFTILYYIRLEEAEDVTAFANPFLVLTGAGLLVGHVYTLIRVLIPHARELGIMPVTQKQSLA